MKFRTLLLCLLVFPLQARETSSSFDSLLRKRLGLKPTRQGIAAASLDLKLILALHPRMRHWIPQARTFLTPQAQSLSEEELRRAFKQQRSSAFKRSQALKKKRKQQIQDREKLQSERYALLQRLNELRREGAEISVIEQVEQEGFARLEALAAKLNDTTMEGPEASVVLLMDEREREAEFGRLLDEIQSIAGDLLEEKELQWLVHRPLHGLKMPDEFEAGSFSEAALEQNLLAQAYRQAPVPGYGDLEGERMLKAGVYSALLNWGTHLPKVHQWLAPTFQGGVVAFTDVDLTLELLQRLWELHGISRPTRDALQQTIESIGGRS